MRRTTIFADEHLLKEIKYLASQEKRSAADLIRDALEQYIRSKQKKQKRLSIIGLGRSGKTTYPKSMRNYFGKHLPIEPGYR